MALDQALLDILCCPVSKSPLRRLDKARIKQLNAAVGAGTLKYSDGAAVGERVREALISGDGERIYLVDDDIPILLEERSIAASALENQD